MNVLSLLVPFLSILLLSGHPCTAKVDKWTPADFPWDKINVGTPDSWNVLYQNLSDSSVQVFPDAIAVGRARMHQDGAQVLSIPFSALFSWQNMQHAAAAASLASAINGCVQNDGTPESDTWCAIGLFGTIGSVGAYASAAKKFVSSRGWFTRASNNWLPSGLDDIEMDVFTADLRKRGLDSGDGGAMLAQRAHNLIVRNALHSTSGKEPIFLGYAPDTHRLSRRTENASHPLAPVYRMQHEKYGHIDMVSRDVDENLHFTTAYAGHQTHLEADKAKRNEVFRHERLSDHLAEARFDSDAAAADPADIQVVAANAFGAIEGRMGCFTQGTWQESSVLSMQLLDNANKATFGFASMGIFPDDSVDGYLADFTPSGLPLTGGQDC